MFIFLNLRHKDLVGNSVYRIMSELQGDTWSELQAHKKKQDSLRERIQRRKKERQGILSAVTEGIFSKN